MLGSLCHENATLQRLMLTAPRDQGAKSTERQNDGSDTNQDDFYRYCVVGFTTARCLISVVDNFPAATMVCDKCGHPNDDHKGLPSSLYYCSQCKSLEQGISFSQESGNDPSKSLDVMTDLYKSFRR